MDSDELIAELPTKILAARESLHEFENTYEMVQEVNAGALSIKVIGVGNGGSNAVSHMHKDQLPASEYWVINTDAQHVFSCDVSNRIAIGSNLTRGLSARANPDLGRQAAEESRTEITQAVEGADLVFIVAGMGGGTSTGASPVVAQIAKDSGALTVRCRHPAIPVRRSHATEERRGGYCPAEGPRRHFNCHPQRPSAPPDRRRRAELHLGRRSENG